MRAKTRKFFLIELVFLFLLFGVLSLNSTIQRSSDLSRDNAVQELTITYQYRASDLSTTQSTTCDSDSDVFSRLNSINGVKVCIPFKNYRDKQFPVLIKNTQNSDELRIKLIGSREFYIERNSQLVYTHRYQERVFYFESSSLHRIQKQLGSSLDVEIKTSGQSNRLGNSLFFLMIILILGNSWLLVRGTQFNERNVVSQKMPRYFFLLIGFLWGASLLAWYFGPRDSIGSTGRSPFGPLAPLFSDFFQIAQSARYGNPYLEGAVNYPAFATLALKGFGDPVSNSLILLVLSLSLSMLTLIYRQIALQYSLSWRQSLILGSASYPILYGLFRGNLDVLVSSLVIASIYFWGKTRNNLASVILLGIAISLKVWPVFFLIPLLKFKKYKELLWTGFVTIVITASSTLIYSGWNIEKFLSIIFSSGESKNSGDISEFSFSYSLRPLFGGIYHLIKFQGFDSSNERLDQVFVFLDSNMMLFVILTLLIFTLLLTFRLKSFNSVFLYSASIPLLFFSPSYSYRAIPIVFYFYLLIMNMNKIDQLNEKNTSRISSWEWVSFAFLLAPATVLFFPGTQISLNTIFQPIGLLALMFFAYLRSNTSYLDAVKKA
jgi:hypothetical protein